MGKTITEKILAKHAGSDVVPGSIVLAAVDFVMGQDGTSPLVIKAFESLGGGEVFDRRKAALVIDHNSPSPVQGVSALHAGMRAFAGKHGIRLYDVGEGVCHVLIPESGVVTCGDLVLGADSHTPTYGALNAMACGMGSTDIAIALRTGRNWFKVPTVIRILFTGTLPPGVCAKDMALSMVGTLTAQGAIYRSVEIGGDALRLLSMDGRMTICNLTTEVGAKCGIMEADETTIAWLKERGVNDPRPVAPDKDAVYERTVTIDVSRLEPQVARPHAVDNVAPVTDVAGTPIRQAFIGTCTNGRVGDFAAAAAVLKGKTVAPGVLLICAPGSRAILLECLEKGYIRTLVESGACVTNPGCGPCVGTHQGVPSDGENVISTANRNFKGRMGNQNSFIYLASPATVAASAIEGKIADPRKYL